MTHPKQFIIEGIDRMGKSSLVENLQHELGYHLVVHNQKPKRLRAYECHLDPLKYYQIQLYRNMFGMIALGHDIIFDRGHLGEMVYAPMYRGYSGDYVLELEKEFYTKTARLVLLTTSDFSFIKDDGLSFDFTRKEEEQLKIVNAFGRSRIEDKVHIDVSNGRGGYKSPDQILAEVLKK